MMDDQLSFKVVCGDGAGKFDIIFVHGLTGDPKDTWQSSNTAEQYWPTWFCEDFPGVRVSSVGYPASVFGRWAKKEMTLYERAENVLESLTSNNIGAQPIAFVTHSLGGLLAKQIIRTANEATDSDWKSVVSQTKLVAYLATPHNGACLAGLLQQFAKPFASTHIAALSNDCGQLDDLNNAYRDIAPQYSIKTVAYYEKFKTKNVLLVDQHSANPGVSGTRPIALDADHITICKPKSRDSLIYKSLRRHLSKFISRPDTSRMNGAFGSSDYAQPHETDRRDLLQKLIDAGREHQYQSAREDQTVFAQRYYKLGLHTEAKLLHDDLLSSVEQRFKLHIYDNKICKRATDQEITNSIQSDIIDPIRLQYKVQNLSAMDVLRAIYFLTQQCHIRWDAP